MWLLKWLNNILIIRRDFNIDRHFAVYLIFKIKIKIDDLKLMLIILDLIN